MDANSDRSAPRPSVRGLLLDRRLWIVVGVSLTLNLWGIGWGLPRSWNADEVVKHAEHMVYSRTLNPNYFMYGNLPLYAVAAVAVVPTMAYAKVLDRRPTPGTMAEAQWWERQHARMLRIARSMSALEATLVVVVTFLIGSLLVDSRVGLVAASAAALAPFHVILAHFATADDLSTLLFWVTVLCSVLLWQRNEKRWYVLAALAAGMAFGSKTDRVMVVFPILTAHFLGRRNLAFGRLALFLLIPVGYVVANPLLLVEPFGFLHGTVRDMFFAGAMDAQGETSYGVILRSVSHGVGWPLLIFLIVGFTCSAYASFRHPRARPAIVFLLSTFLPYYVVFGTQRVQPSYVTQLFPGLFLLAALGVVWAHDRMRAPRPTLARSAMGAVLVLALALAVTADLAFVHDARHEAGRWVASHVPGGATIDVSPRGPFIPAYRYRVTELFPMRDPSHIVLPRARLEGNAVYRSIRAWLLAIESRVRGVPEDDTRNARYAGWYDHFASGITRYTSGGEVVPRETADFMVLVDGETPDVLARIRRADSGYELVRRFHYDTPRWLTTEFRGLHPDVYVFRRSRG